MPIASLIQSTEQTARELAEATRIVESLVLDMVLAETARIQNLFNNSRN